MTDNFPTLPAVDRRGFLRLGGASVAMLSTGATLSACELRGSSSTASDVLKIGLVSPQTGPLASFAAPDQFVIKHVTDSLRNGINAGGRTRRIEVVVRDTQSSPTRATEVAKQLITSDGVDIVIAAGTPDTANPVADQCEASGVPNVTTIVPWESWFYGRGGKSGVGFKYSTNFYAGLDDMANAFVAMYGRIDGSPKTVASLWPDDTDGNAFRNGFGSILTDAKFGVVDGGQYQNGVTDFSPQIAKFKAEGSELFNGIPIPPDFQTFWRQAAQQKYRPKLATIAKSMLFPAEAKALGDLANNIATLGWWIPTFPYKSSIDGTTAQELARSFTDSTGQQWSQALGSLYSLFEVCIEAFKAAGDPKDKEDVADKLRTLRYEGISGPLDFTTGPEPGVALQKCVGVQWRPSKQFDWDLTVVDNTTRPDIPLGGDLQPTFA
ncbi:ABC transporter substrate-binding protein (plasmid) [Paenarthrobacter sp. R1]|uniref:ABC transporter substrate-binding protein n=2 Tax=Paenarthrobacter TaxID=1742992 RepID=A0AAX3EQS2_PAEUR|nr:MULTISPECIES: ABC transporter substrate-binding protein [Paenarthrobacter]NKR12660.1 hypothetical protein [Arthrobacter sp. M5]NKR16495.1 hypothetical protein [Arthrobacter sp. M6]OEH60090.1 hypothetical protein A5N17_17300 [Arthrobacter sp. D2]OEH63726.1 hypothetical protein A5N13_13945 [Arthrobacter sp. D4]MDO5878294.1 ABC transporter substrate-binding protein [Paenarthrobacter sp. SD-1]